MPSSPDPSSPDGGHRPDTPPTTPLRELAAVIGAEYRTAGPASDPSDHDTVITGIELEAQSVRPGDLFAALPGTRTHGAVFATVALEHGAVAVLTDPAGYEVVDSAVAASVPVLVHPEPRAILGAASAAVYGHPSNAMQIIGITGTSGKTTTAYLVDAGLTAAGRTTGLVGTVETRIAGRRLPSALTTPEAPHLHALLASMLERGVDTVVMEVSSHALSLGRVAETAFAVGGFTNLSQDHLDFHKDLDDYFAAKAGLFAADSPVAARRAVVCVDDEWGRRMADIARDAHPGDTTAVRSVSTSDTAADWSATDVFATPSGLQKFTLTGPDGRRHAVSLGLPGGYNVANAALAIALCHEVGADIDDVLRGIAQVAVPGRVERIDRGQDFLAVVDYAHKPAALEAVIDTLRQGSTGRIAVVIGAGGDRDRGKRPLMGRVAATSADLVVVTDDNPRSEEPADIRAAVLAGAHAVPVETRAEIREIGDRAAAIEHAVQWAGPGDIVLVAGKGHERGQLVRGITHPFDDRDELAAAIERQQRSGGTQ